MFRRILNISRTLTITNQEVLKRVQLKKAGLLADTTNKKMGHYLHVRRHSTFKQGLHYKKRKSKTRAADDTTMRMANIAEWSGLCYVEATRRGQDRNYWQLLIASDPVMDGN